MSETAAEWFEERADMLHVSVAKSVSGEGWDVVLRIDGSYSDEAMAREAAETERLRLANLDDVNPAGRDWWEGPPWEAEKRAIEASARAAYDAKGIDD